MPTDLTDEEVLAELTEQERIPFRFGITKEERVERPSFTASCPMVTVTPST